MGVMFLTSPELLAKARSAPSRLAAAPPLSRRSQMFMGEKFGRDSIWETHLVHELWNTDIDIEAILGEQRLTLGEVLRWKPGSQIFFNTDPETFVDMVCGNVVMFRGKVGRKKDALAIKIEDVLDPQKEESYDS